MWAWIAFINSAFIQASTYLSRPMITYKLLILHSNNFVVGTFGALYALFPLLLAVALGRWVNQYGEGRFILYGTILIVISTSVLMVANSIALMVVAVAALGTAQLLCMIGAQAMFANRSPSGNYERFFGLYTFSAALGQLFGPLIGSAVSGSHGVLPKSTSHAFLAAAILGALGIIPLLRKFPMGPTVGVSAKESREQVSFSSVLQNPGMKLAMFTSLAISSSVDVLVVFLPVFGKERGFSSSSIGIVLAIRALTSMASRVYLGKMTEVIGFWRLLLGSIAISSIACVVATSAHHVLFLYIVIGVAGFSLGVGQPMTMAWVSRLSKDPERSFTISVRLAGNRFGQFLLPALAGVIAGPLGASAVFVSLAILMGSSGVLTRIKAKNH